MKTLAEQMAQIARKNKAKKQRWRYRVLLKRIRQAAASGYLGLLCNLEDDIIINSLRADGFTVCPREISMLVLFGESN